MIVLPIAERELRVAARRKATYRNRFWTVFAAGCIFGGIMLSFEANYTAPAQRGTTLFQSFSLLCFVYCLLIGARTTADCISEEKREGTLGLLFLTDLGGADVVFGKMVASALNAFYGLLAILPMLGL